MFGIRYYVVVILLLVKLTYSDPPEKIVLSIYYESRCPDSKSFVIDQLLPTVGILHNYIDLRLIPFGKAHSIYESYFECQHGPTECAGNMVQSCTIDVMYEYGTVSDLRMARYVACEMETEAGTRGDLTCVHQAGVNTNVVDDCVRSRKGIELQLRNEYLTNLVRPKFIPTITFNGIFNQEIQDSAFEDLKGTLCSYLRDAPPCSELYNDLAIHSIML